MRKRGYRPSAAFVILAALMIITFIGGLIVIVSTASR
jgi:hypothetical protein